MSKDFRRELSQPFDESYIQWRVQNAGVIGNWCYVNVIPYIKAKGIQDRLDDVFGLFGWENKLKETLDGKGFLCGITIFDGDKSVTKWDGAQLTNVQPLKGAISDAMKRTGSLLGVGRYLRDLGTHQALCGLVATKKEAKGSNIHTHYPERNNKSVKQLIAWEDPTLPKWALPGFNIDLYIDDMKNAKTHDELEEAYLLARKSSILHDDRAMLEKAKSVGVRVREEINKVSALNVAKDTAAIVIWAKKQSDALALIPHQASVESVFNVIIGLLKGKVKGTVVDIGPIQKSITDKFNQRIKQLEQEQ